VDSLGAAVSIRSRTKTCWTAKIAPARGLPRALDEAAAAFLAACRPGGRVTPVHDTLELFKRQAPVPD
jgi:protein tyrosine phosphatase (PTP) superfamily phosphohydrolase (DUF442 family)